jgi:hypothetical protein
MCTASQMAHKSIVCVIGYLSPTFLGKRNVFDVGLVSNVAPQYSTSNILIIPHDLHGWMIWDFGCNTNTYHRNHVCDRFEYCTRLFLPNCLYPRTLPHMVILCRVRLTSTITHHRKVAVWYYVCDALSHTSVWCRVCGHSSTNSWVMYLRW